MKIAGKRIPKGNVLLFISFAAVSLCFLIIVSVARTEWENALIKNDMYTGHEAGFYIHGAESEKQWEETISKLASAHDNFSLNVSVPTQEMLVRGICIKGEVNTPPMLLGEYFDYLTSWTDKPKAVLGKEFQKDVFAKDGKNYYLLEDMEFEVIGIMGTVRDSRLNHMVIIDFKTAIHRAGINTQYCLDTNTEDTVRDVGQDVEKFFSEPGSVVIGFGKDSDVPLLSKLLSSGAIMDTMYVLILISFSLSTVLVSFIWLRFRKQLLFSWSLCGYERKSEWREIFKRYYLASGAGVLSGFMMMPVLSVKITDIHMRAMDFILALGMTLGLGTVILFFSFWMFRKKVILL